MSLLDLNNKNFDELVKDGNVLVDFYADWCMPCKMQAPVVHEIASEYKEYKVGKINVDDDPELSERFNVVSIPTLLVFKNGNVVKKFVGVTSKEDILAALK